METLSQPEPQSARLGLLYELGQSFSAVLDLPELLTQIVDAAVALVQAKEGLAILADEESGSLTIQAIRTAETPAAQAMIRHPSDPLAMHVHTHSEPLLITPGDNMDNYGSTGIASDPLLYVPLSTKTHKIGVLGVLGKEDEQTFTHHDQDMLAGLAGYAAFAIGNALLYRQALDRTIELRRLVESANALSWSLDLGQVLNAIARHMMRGLEAHWCIISSWEPQTGRIPRLAEYRSALWPLGSGPQSDLDALPFHKRALSHGKPLAIHPEDSTEPGAGDLLTSLHCNRLLIMPLQLEGMMVGLAELSNLYETRPFTPAEIGQCIRSTLGLVPLLKKGETGRWADQLQAAARSLLDVADADWCTLYTWETQAHSLTRLLDYGTGIWLDQPAPETNTADLPTLGIVLEEQRVAVLRSTNPRLHPGEQRLFQGIGPSALLALPLVVKARSVGVVQLYDIDPGRTFTEREMGMARAMANQAAVALENAQLVRDLQKSLDEQKAMQGHLVRAARLSALGELSAVIAHQINNPLTTIIGDAEMLVQDIPHSQVAHDSAKAILRAGQRAKHVVERVLNMARHEDEPHLIEVNKTIEEALGLVRSQIERGRSVLTLELAPALPLVKAIPGQLEDVWLNLLTNAHDAVSQVSDRQGHILIRSGVPEGGRRIEISVEDNGSGIPHTHLERIFDPFSTTKPRGKGTGLGLYICHQIVTDHNGQIEVASTLGKGTKVTVHLPIATSTDKESLWPTS